MVLDIDPSANHIYFIPLFILCIHFYNFYSVLISRFKLYQTNNHFTSLKIKSYQINTTDHPTLEKDKICIKVELRKIIGSIFNKPILGTQTIALIEAIDTEAHFCPKPTSCEDPEHKQIGVG